MENAGVLETLYGNVMGLKPPEHTNPSGRRSRGFIPAHLGGKLLPSDSQGARGLLSEGAGCGHQPDLNFAGQAAGRERTNPMSCSLPACPVAHGDISVCWVARGGAGCSGQGAEQWQLVCTWCTKLSVTGLGHWSRQRCPSGGDTSPCGRFALVSWWFRSGRAVLRPLML